MSQMSQKIYIVLSERFLSVSASDNIVKCKTPPTQKNH